MPEPPHAMCSGLRPDHGGREVRVGTFVMCRGLGENADRVVVLDRPLHQPGAVDAGLIVCDSCRLCVPGIGIVEAWT
jgi:hypothetical protein